MKSERQRTASAECSLAFLYGNEKTCGPPVGAAVKAAVEAGDVDHERFESFLKLRDEVDAEAAERQAGRRR